MSQPNTSPPKFLALESLRGMAALLVALFHFNFVISEKPPIIAQGDIFVDFFFVLSGFVIAFAYDSKIRSRMSFVDFFILRVGRLYPLHLFILLVWLPYILAKYVIFMKTGMGSDPTETNDVHSFVLNLAMLQSMGFDDSLSWNGPSWSISVELAAYVVFFAVVSVTRRLPGKWIIPLVSLASYAILFAATDDSLLRTHDYGVFRCIGGFFAGAALRLWCKDIKWEIPAAVATTLEITSMIAMFGCVSQIRGSILFECLSFVSFIFVIFVFSIQKHGAISTILQHPKLVFLGTISYSLYMVHAIVAFVSLDTAIYIFKMQTVATEGGAKMVTTNYAPFFTVAYLAVITLISTLTYKWVEKPFRDRAKDWVAGRSKVTSPAKPS